MKNFIYLLLISFTFSNNANANLTISSPSCDDEIYTTKELTNQAKPGVVTIYVDDGNGSGFVVKHIENGTLILTNSHVIQGARNITVEWPDGTQDYAEVVLDGGESLTVNDLALLKVNRIVGKVLPLKNSKAIVGEDVIAIGAPDNLSFTITKGIISSLREQGKFIQTDTAINPGNSGGPLINQSGCVVGINTFIYEESEGLNFAISSHVANNFINQYQSNYNSFFPKKNSFVQDNNFRIDDQYDTDNQNNFSAEAYLIRLDDIYKIPGEEKETIKLASIVLVHQKSSKAYFYRAYAKNNIKDYQGAIIDYSRAIEIEPEYAIAYSNRGVAKYYLEDFRGAIIDYTKAIRIYPEYGLAYYNRALAKDNLQDYQGAIFDYSKAIKYDKSNTSAFKNRGILKENMNDIKGACSDWLQAARLGDIDSKKWFKDQCYKL